MNPGLVFGWLICTHASSGGSRAPGLLATGEGSGSQVSAQSLLHWRLLAYSCTACKSRLLMSNDPQLSQTLRGWALSPVHVTGAQPAILHFDFHVPAVSPVGAPAHHVLQAS